MKDMFRIDGKVAVVVGGAGGIGESCALALADRGAQVVVADLAAAASKLDEVCKKVASEKNVAPERIEMFLAKSPLKRLAVVEDIAGACVYLACPASDFVTGQILYVDGGLTAIA